MIARSPIELMVHVLAGAAALLYAWNVSGTAYVQTGLQFVTPLIVIVAVHLSYMAVTGRLSVGFSDTLFRKSLQTSLAVMICITLATVLAPMPAEAAGSSDFGGILVFLFCAAVLLGVVFALAFAIKLLVFLARAAHRKITGKGGETRLFDVGSVLAVALLLGVSSMEGVWQSFSFEKSGTTSAIRSINAPSADVWSALQTATSPKFRLPQYLSAFPQPVAVTIDEGVALGSMRQVRFEGREGAGYLNLQVVERTPNRVRFAILSDTTPFAQWIGFTALTYSLAPEGDGSRLEVSLDYNRHLAPAWFFKPLMSLSGKFAMDVLARDVAQRAITEAKDG
ncbi:SRPBCC family protein [Pseudahrensia aquimaris]|uniref:SRPBCC family protein n=1 Tax=Pseudahrensia aquimaris TaxID=744461 RepID=A0ABW3FF84_9HYPH